MHRSDDDTNPWVPPTATTHPDATLPPADPYNEDPYYPDPYARL